MGDVRFHREAAERAIAERHRPWEERTEEESDRDDDPVNRTGHLSCSFCGKSQRDVQKLIAGPTVYICDECIVLCNEIMIEDGNEWSWAPKKGDAYDDALSLACEETRQLREQLADAREMLDRKTAYVRELRELLYGGDPKNVKPVNAAIAAGALLQHRARPSVGMTVRVNDTGQPSACEKLPSVSRGVVVRCDHGWDE